MWDIKIRKVVAGHYVAETTYDGTRTSTVSIDRYGEKEWWIEDTGSWAVVRYFEDARRVAIYSSMWNLAVCDTTQRLCLARNAGWKDQ